MNLSAEQLSRAVEGYRGGKALYRVAEEMHTDPRVLKRAFLAAGVPIRSKSETCRIRAVQNRASPIRRFTAEQLAALYHRDPQPSLRLLAERFGVTRRHLTRVLQEHGILIREREEQLALGDPRGWERYFYTKRFDWRCRRNTPEGERDGRAEPDLSNGG